MLGVSSEITATGRDGARISERAAVFICESVSVDNRECKQIFLMLVKLQNKTVNFRKHHSVSR